MKKLIGILLATTLVLALAACGEAPQSQTENATQAVVETTEAAIETEATTPAVETTEATVPVTEAVHTHSYAEKVTAEATCTAAGTKTFTCECGDSYTEAIPVLAHSYNGKVTKAATCTQKGSKTYTCSCGKTYTEELKATGHKHTVTASKKATCTEDGYATYTCSCGDSYTNNEKASGHSLSGWTNHTNATMLSPGEKRNSCANCDYYESEMSYQRMFEHYADVVGWFGVFENVQQLENDYANFIDLVFYESLVDLNTTFDEGVYIHRIPVSEMNKITKRYFGTTYDFTGVNRLQVLTEARCSYEAETDELVITAYPIGSGEDDFVSERTVTYTTQDNIHFEVKVASDRGWSCIMNVQLQDGSYVITSYTDA